jgi:hypothetical protein
MDEGLKEITAQKMTLYEQTATQLERTKRIRLRNEIVMLKLSVGTPLEEIQETFKLSKRRLYAIIQEAEQGAEFWFNSLPKKYMMEIFRYNTNEIQNEIKHLADLRQKTSNEDIDLDRQITNDIINARSNLIRTIADGPALLRTRELTEKLEKQQENK